MMDNSRLLFISGLLLLCCLGTVQAAGTGMVYVTDVTDVTQAEPGWVHLYLDNQFAPPAGAYNVQLTYDNTVIAYVEGAKKNATIINPVGNVITINGFSAEGYPLGSVWLADLKFAAVANPSDGGSSSVNITVNSVRDTDITEMKTSVTIQNGTVTTRDEVPPAIVISTPSMVSSTFNVTGTITDVGGMGTATAYLVNGTENVTVPLTLHQTAADTWIFDTRVTWPVYEPMTVKVSATDAAGNSAMQTKLVQVSPVGFSHPEPTGYLKANPALIQVFTQQMDHSSVTLTLTGPATVPLDVTFSGDYAQNTTVPDLDDGTWTVTASGIDTIDGTPRTLAWDFTKDTFPPVINTFAITDTDGDGYLEADEQLNFNWNVAGAGVVHLMDNDTKEVFFTSTDAVGSNSTTIAVGNRNMVFAAFDEAGNAAYRPFHLYYNYMAWVNSTKVGTVSGIDTNLTAVRQLDLKAQGSVVFYNACRVPFVPLGTIQRSVTSVGQVTSDTYVAVDRSANATYTGADTYDCVWTYDPSKTLDFCVQAPNINAANLLILEANESYVAQMANEGRPARDTINYEDLIKKSAWIFIEGGYTKIVVNPDGTFSQPEAEGRALTVAASGNIIDTLRIAANQVNLTAGYRLSAQNLPTISLPAGDYALAAISMDGDRIGAIAAMPFTVMESGERGTVPTSVTRGTSFTASFPCESERLGVVVIRDATWDAQVGINATTIGVGSASANLTYNGVPATKKLYGNVYASPDAAVYAYARNASSVSIPTDDLLAGPYNVYMVAESENGTVHAYECRKIVVQNPSVPVANFTASPMTGFAPLTVAFADISTGSINNRLWNFGDGTNSTEQNPTHVFNAVGTYTVRLTVTGYGGSTTMSKQIVVTSPVPFANFTATPTSGTVPLNVTFTDLSTGNIASRFWDFGDGKNSTAPNPYHVFNSVGTFTVNLTVTGPDGRSWKSTAITVTAAPTPTPTPYRGGGGGGSSGPSVVPPPASGASALSIFTSFTLPGATFGTSGNAQTLSLDLGTAKGAKVSGDTITLEQDGLTYVIKVSGISRNGDIVTGTVTDVTVKITPMTGTFNRTGGATASFVAHFPSYPTGARLSATLDEKPPEGVVSAYSLALRSDGLDVGEVAYTLTVKKTGIEATGPATITMAIDTAWVTAHGGVNEMRIVRQADDGTTEVLETVFRGYNAAGQYVFEAQSPNGLSVIGLVAVTAASSVPATTTTVPAAETTAPTGETTTPAGEGGFPLLPTLVILVIVIALVAVGYRFMKQN